MITAQQIIEDYRFAIDSEEFGGHLTPALRYVAALNPTASRREFVEALGTIGLHPGTCAKQFGLSRRFDADAYNVAVEADGRILTPY